MTKDPIDIQIEFNNRLLAAFEPKLFVPLADHQEQIAELEAENKRLRGALQTMWHLWMWVNDTCDVDGDALNAEESEALGIAKKEWYAARLLA